MQQICFADQLLGSTFKVGILKRVDKWIYNGVTKQYYNCEAKKVTGKVSWVAKIKH